MQKNIVEILKINFALVFTAIIVGLIVSIVAQFFSLIAKNVFNLIQSEQSLTFSINSLYDSRFIYSSIN